MFRSLATSAVALLAAASPLFADVTPAQVWDNLRNYYADMGYQVTTGSSDQAGDTLTLGDIAILSSTSAGAVSISIPKMTLQQTGDARVRTVIDGEMTADFASTGAGDDDVAAHTVISVPGNEMLSSGSPDEMLHELAYPTIDIAARFETAGKPAAGEDMPVSLVMSDVKGSYRSVPGEGADSTYDMTVAALDLELSLTDQGSEDGSEGTGAVSARTHVEDLTMTGSMTAPTGQVDMAEKPHEALAAGMVIRGRMAMGALSGAADFTGTDAEGVPQSGSATFSSDSGELAVDMSQEGLSYSGSASGSNAQLTISDLPFPISYAVETASGALNFPIAKSDQPQPYKLTYSLAGLTLADAVWDLFDPQKTLPRDPADLEIDLEGQAMVTEDLLDPAFAERMAKAAEEQAAAQSGTAADEATNGDAGDAGMPTGMPAPFRPETVKINRVAVDAVGAWAEIAGDLTLPEDGTQPVGTVEGDFTGVTALLDSLVAAGLVPQDQMMAARMMVAMFARPAEDDPDRLQTRLEFREDGSIFANGQQVK